MYGGGAGVAAARGPNGNCCAVGVGEEATVCGVGCGGAGQGALSFVGTGQGEYIQETTYKYVGCGGDFDTVRPRRDFTCLITSCCLLSLLLLIPLLCWLISGMGSTELYNCSAEMNWEAIWSEEQKEFCCATTGVGCQTTQPATAAPTQPPTPPPTPPPTGPPPTLPATSPPTQPLPTPPPGPVDPYNCAVAQYSAWTGTKQTWCCHHHHICGQPTSPPAPADPYNCADGFANWQAGWSVGKKAWCCHVHGKGCPGQGNGCAPIGTTSPPYDCNAGFANWMAGWSAPKKVWCCANAGKGCQQNGGCV